MTPLPIIVGLLHIIVTVSLFIAHIHTQTHRQEMIMSNR